MSYQQYRRVCLGMLAAGLTLPVGLAVIVPNTHVTPFIWNFLQFGGLVGLFVFSLFMRLSAKPAA